MSIPESNNLFRGSDSQAILNYFLSRLHEGDLSSEEALAILGAVHAELGKGSFANPKIYKLYTSAMKSLQQSMPHVYDYVVSSWSREKNSESKSHEVPDTDSDEGDIEELNPKNNESGSDKGFAKVKAEEEIDNSEESLEEEEFDESEADQSEKAEEENNKSDLKDTGESSEEETGDDESEEKDDKVEDTQELNDENTDGSVEEIEASEAKENENDLSEEETKVEKNDEETSEESGSVEAISETDPESEKDEPNREEGTEEEENEWPETNESLPEEPPDVFGGEENPAPED